MREMRRLLRLQRLRTPTEARAYAAAAEAPAPCPPDALPVTDKLAQFRLILELALKTISLMQKSSVIQQRIAALKQETSEFVASVMSNPENRQRYMEHARMYGLPTQMQLDMPLQQLDIPLRQLDMPLRQ